MTHATLKKEPKRYLSNTYYNTHTHTHTHTHTYTHTHTHTHIHTHTHTHIHTHTNTHIHTHTHTHTACQELEAPAHGNVTYSNGIAKNSVASFSCQPPYTLLGTQTKTCGSRSTWSGSQPECVGEPYTYIHWEREY